MPTYGPSETINAQIQNLKGNYSQALINLLELEYLFNENKPGPLTISGIIMPFWPPHIWGRCSPIEEALEAARKGIALVGKNNAIALLNNTKESY